MTWEIDLKTRTAETGGFEVRFSPMPAGSKIGADCFRDPEGIIWRGKVVLGGAAIRDEALRLHMLHEAADAYGKASCSGLGGHPEECNDEGSLSLEAVKNAPLERRANRNGQFAPSLEISTIRVQTC